MILYTLPYNIPHHTTYRTIRNILWYYTVAYQVIPYHTIPLSTYHTSIPRKLRSWVAFDSIRSTTLLPKPRPNKNWESYNHKRCKQVQEEGHQGENIAGPNNHKLGSWVVCCLIPFFLEFVFGTEHMRSCLNCDVPFTTLYFRLMTAAMLETNN